MVGDGLWLGMLLEALPYVIRKPEYIIIIKLNASL